MKGDDPVAETEALPSLAPKQEAAVELVVAVTEQAAGMVIEQGVPSVRVVEVLKLVPTVAVLINATNPEVVTHVIPTDAPETKFVLVIVSRNLPMLTVEPGLIGQFTAAAEFPNTDVLCVTCIRRLEAVYATL